jgi:hypothetical protein
MICENTNTKYGYAIVFTRVASLYTRDGQLKVTRGPVFRKLKSSGTEHIKIKIKKKGHSKYEF